MIPVEQVNLREAKGDDPRLWGDCFRACLCSILELPIEAIPVLHDPEKYNTLSWVDPWREWLWENYRLRLVFVAPGSKAPYGWYGIGTFRVRGEDHLHHAVVMGDEIIWDPWPGSDGSDLGELCQVAVLAPVTINVEIGSGDA